MNRTIVMELAGLVEVVLHDVLSGLRVSGPGVDDCPLRVPDHMALEKLIELAGLYGLIDGLLAERLRGLNAARNAIHFKRFHKQRILEYDYYKEAMVRQAVETFEVFLKAIAQRVSPGPHRRMNFVYPWTETLQASSDRSDDGRVP